MEGTNSLSIKSIAIKPEQSQLDDSFSIKIILNKVDTSHDLKVKVVYQIDAINSNSAQIELSDSIPLN